MFHTVYKYKYHINIITSNQYLQV